MNLVFDIGYNTGGVTRHWINNFWPDVKIIGVEPNIETLNLENCFLCDQVTVVNHCISDRDNVDYPFYISHLHPISTCSTDWLDGRFKGSWNRQITVKSVTIDTLIEKFGKPEYIKIDVEGFELNALMGLTHKVNYISFEWTEEGKDTVLIPCLNRLKELGFTQFSLTETDDIENPEILNYCTWDEFEIIVSELSLIPELQAKWGMVYAK